MKPLSSSWPVYGVILCGGQSRRFGSDKALFEIEGQPLVQRAADLLEPQCDHLILSSHSTYSIRQPHRLVADHEFDQGPLGGILSVLSEIDAGQLLILAVDLVAVTPATIARILEDVDGTQNDEIQQAANHKDQAHMEIETLDQTIVVAQGEGANRIQPLLGRWPVSVKANLAAFYNQGSRSVMGFLAQTAYRTVMVSEGELKNLNTPG